MSERTYLSEEQPSVATASWLTRVVGIGAGAVFLPFSLAAWYVGSIGWLIAELTSFFLLAGLITWLSSIPLRKQKELDSVWARRFHELAIRDELTGLYNRRFFNQELARLSAESNANMTPLTLALIDLNDFKSINDTYGHHMGDAALRLVADCIRGVVAETGISARTGGDEFAVILPDAAPAQAAAIVAAIRAALDSTPISLNGSIDTGARVRAAVGLAALDEFDEVERLLRQADSALYENKRELGRLSDRRRAS